MKTHPTDLVSLVTGLLFTAIAIVAIAGGLTVDVLSAEWVWPSALVLLGLLVLATAGLGRRGDTDATTDHDDDAGAEVADDPAGPADPTETA